MSPLPQRQKGGTSALIDDYRPLSARGLAEAASQGDGSYELFRHAAGVFGQVSSRIGQMADDAAQAEGQEAGAMAGLDPEFRLKGDRTIYGDAFDRAALSTYKSKMTVDVTAALEAAFDKHQDNPTELGKALEAVRSGWAETIDNAGGGAAAKHVKPDFEVIFSRQSTGLMREATRNFHGRVRADQLAATENELSVRWRTATQQAFRLGLDATADQVLAGELAEAKSRLAVAGPDGRPIIAPDTQAKLLRDMEADIARARIGGAFSRLDGLDAKARFIDDIEKRYQKGGDPVLDLFDPSQYQAMVSTLVSQARSEELGAEQANRALGREIKAFQDRAEDGVELSDADAASLRGRVAMTGKTELVEAFNKGVDTLATVRRLNTMAPAEIEATIEATRAEFAKNPPSIDGPEFARLQLAEKYADKARKELGSNPLGFASRAGVARVLPLDLTSADNMRQRAATAEHVAHFYGRDVVYFQPEEKTALAAAARKGGDGMLAIAANIADGFGEAAPRALAEISKEAPELALIGGLWNAAGTKDPPPVARDAAKGIELRTVEPDKFKSVAPAKDKARGLAAGVVGQSLAELPAAGDAAIATANAAYEARARRDGLAEFDEKVWTGILEEVLGKSTHAGAQYGGVALQIENKWWDGRGAPGGAVIVPANVKTDGFRDLLEAIRTEDLSDRPRYADGTTAPIAEVRRATLRNVGAKRYWLALGDPDSASPQWLANKDGQKYVLDLGALEPVLRKRRPDLYLEGR